MNHPPTPEEDDAIFALVRAGQLTRNQLRGLQDRLWWYGWIVIRGHLGSGTMAKINIGHPHRMISEDEADRLRHAPEIREEIAADALSRALPLFLDGLSSGRSWNPSRKKRASITTYWTVALAAETYKAVGRWADEEHRIKSLAIREKSFEYAPANEPVDVVTRQAQRLALRSLLPSPLLQRSDRSTRDQRAIAALVLAGHEPPAIASRLRLDVRRVRYLMNGLRDHAWLAVALLRFDTQLFPEVQRRIEAMLFAGLSPQEVARELKVTLRTATELCQNWGGEPQW